MGAGFRDEFSTVAAGYARFRPRYPDQLFDHLASLSSERGAVWDCATGSGQAAVGLAGRFAAVFATDASVEQLSHAAAHARIHYAVARAEHPPLASASVDLVTVAQALHWVDLEAFYREARRVGRPHALLAVWSYSLLRFADAAIDRLVHRFATEAVGSYWPPERHHIDSRYRNLPFPFDELPSPPIAMRGAFTLPALAGYLRTWSAVRRAAAATGTDPVVQLVARLSAVWGDPADLRSATFPLSLRVGRLHAG